MAILATNEIPGNRKDSHTDSKKTPTTMIRHHNVTSQGFNSSLSNSNSTSSSSFNNSDFTKQSPNQHQHSHRHQHHHNNECQNNSNNNDIRRQPRNHHSVNSASNSHVFMTSLLLVTLVVFASVISLANGQRPDEEDKQMGASLGFVFDITGSMYDDLQQVILGAKEILKETLKRIEKPLSNYVLVPFHDPVVGPVLVTEDPEEFQDNLRNLYVQGGGDCPEMSIAAIQEALRVSLPFSFIYVFTDARSKDYYLTEGVLTLIQQKRSQVVFVLTGDCGNNSHSGYRAYEEIAATSSGQVFLLKKSQVNQVLNFVKSAVQARKVNLLAIDAEEGRNQVFNIPLDSHLKEITISVSGKDPRIYLRDPEGKKKNRRNGLNTLLSLKKVHIVNVKNPQPGTWRLKVNSKSAHTIRVTGLSTADFVAGFTKYPTKDIRQTSLRPIQGIPTHVLVNSTGLEYPSTLTDLELVDLRGNTLDRFSLKQDPVIKTLYNVSSFIPPNKFFYVRVTGIDEDGFVLQRTTPTAISPLEPRAPHVRMKEVTNGIYDRTATLVCQVFSLVPYSVKWFYKGKQKGFDIFLNDSENVTLEIPHASSQVEGRYSCNATNNAGKESASTFLDISDPPPVVLQPNNVSSLPGETAILECRTISTVAYNLTWEKVKPYRNIAFDPRIRPYTDNSVSTLTINNVNPKDEGKYNCIASNEGGSSTESVYLQLQVAPKAKVSPRRHTFTEGSTRNFTCSAQGYPAPSVAWTRRDGKSLASRSRVEVNGASVSFRNLKSSDEGDYRCEATNLAGKDVAEFKLAFIESPRIREYEPKTLVAVGGDAKLKCIADGIPTPNISWYRSDRMLQSAYGVDTSRPGYMVIAGIQKTDEGLYRCVATNEAGSSAVDLVLEVGSKPEIILPPESTGIEIEGKGSLFCRATGEPPPKVSWRHGDGRPLTQDQGSRFKQLSTGALEINGIQRSDEGLYTCVASNPFGVTDSSAFLKVTGIVQPLIAFTDPNLRVVEGQTATLECSIMTGNPKPSLSWSHDGSRLKESQRLSYSSPSVVTIADVREEDEGQYVCRAHNIGGNDTFIFTLDVKLRPRFTFDSEDDEQTKFTVVEGRSVFLPCKVQGDPPPVYSWFKDGNRISETDIRYFVNSDGALEIFSADRADTGDYKCVASNNAGEAQKDMHLFVEVLPQIGGDLDEEFQINVGESILLTCDVSGVPVPTVKWNKNFLPMTIDPQRHQIQDNGLYIAEATIDDKAIYECVASNVAGQANKNIIVIVYIRPSIKEGPEEVTVLYGQSAVLDCEATGDPTPTILWRKDNVILDTSDPNNGYFTSASGSLTITAVELKHGGRYSCSATNPAGVASKETRLIVHGTPEIPGSYSPYMDVIEGNPIILPCPAEGTPNPTITWYKDSEELTDQNVRVVQLEDGSLEIDSTMAEDTGLYECIAANVAGIATRNIEVKILVPPRLVGINTLESNQELTYVIVDQNVTLTCPVSLDTEPIPFITWYKDNQRLVQPELDQRILISADQRSLTILSAVVGDEARYLCVASNVAGEVERHFDLNVQVPPRLDESGASPYNQTVKTGQSFVINCPAMGKPPPEVEWVKDGERLSAGLDPNVRFLAEGRRLEVTNARFTDRGRYVCIAKNIAGKTDKDFVIDVHVPASVEDVGIPEKVEIVTGKSIFLFCPASGIPPPKITWFRRDVPIKENSTRVAILDNGWTLEIRGANTSDADRYFCAARNEAGDAEKAFDVSVLVGASVNIENLDDEPSFLVNTTAVLNCPVSGNPAPQIIWFRNGVILDASQYQRYEIMAGGRQLRIHSSQVKDTGHYTCTATNKAGDDQVDYQLTILVPPKIDKQGHNVDIKIMINMAVTLSCPVVGYPPPEVIWLKDNQPVEYILGRVEARSDGTELRLSGAQVSDSGRYKCIAKNRAGKDNKDFKVSVQVPPSISGEGVDLNPRIIENDTSILLCPAEGTPPPSILWFKDGILQDGISSPNVQITDNGKRLVISSTSVTDSGDYVCIVSNEAGEAELNFKLDVWVHPVIDTSSIDLQLRVIKDDTAIIECPASGNPPPSIVWLKNGKEVRQDARISVINDGLRLRIKNAKVNDSGDYTCIATNSAGSDSAVHSLTVLVPPSIDESNVVYDRKVSIHRHVELECPVSGVPLPSVLWLVNGQPLEIEDHENMRLSENNRKLEILSVEPDHTALYTCLASNDAGDLKRDFNLDVLIPPEIDREGIQTVVEVIQNKSVSLQCPAIGEPEPDIEWTKDGNTLPEVPYGSHRFVSDGQILELTNIQMKHAGKYKCVASNSAGSDSINIEMNVFVPPLIGNPSPDKLYVVEGQSISMRCTVIGTPEPSVFWLDDEEKINEADEESQMQILDKGQTLQIVHAKASHEGRFTCHAENKVGFALKYFDLEVWSPAKINGSGRRVEVPVVMGQEVILKCPVEGSPTPEIIWYRKSVPIPSYGMPNIRIQENGQQLVIISAQLLDFGEYACLARNNAGDDRLQFVVNIIVPPEIEDGVEEVAAIVNNRAILQCESSGQPEPEVTWTKDGTPFPNTGLRHRMFPSGTMEFMVVRLEDNGNYECTASNGAGNVSRSIQLHVQIPAKILEKRRTLVKVAKGKSVMLICRTEGSPAPQLHWLKNRQLVTQNDRMRIMENGSLYISDLVRRDSGTYTCLAQNNAGTDSRDIRLRVQEPPVINIRQKVYTVLENRTAILSCRARGRPTPTVGWERQGQKISKDTSPSFSSQFIILQDGSLAIPQTRAEDEGTYTCIAENGAGSTRAEINVLVQVPPLIQDAALRYLVSVGDTVSLPCKTIGKPKPTVTWTKDRRRLDLRRNKYVIENSGTLTIRGIRAADTGNYICSAENDLGKDSQSRLLRVQVPPKFLTVPRDRELTINSRFQLRCVARGSPTPTITWKLNGKPFAAPPSLNGISKIVVRNAMKEDAGEYTCIATNPANDQQVTTSARVIIKVPPRILVPPGDKAVRIADIARIDCKVGGDPPPEVLWTRNGRPLPLGDKFQKLSNGSLVIYDLTSRDAALYKCIAINDVGTTEAQSVITVYMEPTFKIEPRNASVEIGATAMFDCVADGVPAPNVSWWNEAGPIEDGDRIFILPNNSLRIVATQQSDVGTYRCLASNLEGRSYIETWLDVVVHGAYSEWGEWGPCSVTCGSGRHSRDRVCDNPSRQNGGRECEGPDTEWATCLGNLCPVDGQWGSWLDWDQCSTSCGPGHRIRQRMCNNPPQQAGGAPCEGPGEQRRQCSRQPCPVDGQWGQWLSWGACSSSCGQGNRERFRQCDSPPRQHGGESCYGNDSQQESCTNRQCAVDGNWSLWSSWGSCSLSCGGGVHLRRRRCDNPRPQNGGLYCSGSDQQQDYCNNEPCPVHGNWGDWGSWGQCSLSCGTGQRKRFRMCSRPVPSSGGRPCTGSGEESDTCNTHNCPVDGRFSQWSDWSDCSVSCGQGRKERYRDCIEPAHGGRTCQGDSSEINPCDMPPCYAFPVTAQGRIVGFINDIEIKNGTIQANMIPSVDGTASHIEAIVDNIKPEAANHLQHLISVLTPVYWTTAHEIQGASNGYTLTNGEFQRDVQVVFATGEILNMVHYANGVDPNGELDFSVFIAGNVPDLGLLTEVYLYPYREEYIQTGQGTVYAHSSRMFKADEFSIPYAWNHTIKYDGTLGQMPFLVQDLETRGHLVEILPGQKSVRFILESSIRPGNPSNKCPQGFLHNQLNSYCQDEDECRRVNPCSHSCLNAPGSFACSCPSGYTLMSDAKTCQDIDECRTGIANCLPNQDCLNRQGTHRCLSKCPQGFKRDENGETCIDINECEEDPNACEQNCRNEVGSYRCSCLNGFRLVGNGRCLDIDECSLSRRQCSHNCTNTRGSYRCSCPSGYQLMNGRMCQDINECYEGKDNCARSQECVNVQGTFKCVEICPTGFQRIESGRCVDVDECYLQTHRCFYNQRCINRHGGYICRCPKGFTSRGLGQPCVDIDECQINPGICSFRCRNTQGSYECLCPPGQLRLADRKSCAGLEFLEPARVLPAPQRDEQALARHQYNQRSHLQNQQVAGQEYAHARNGHIAGLTHEQQSRQRNWETEFQDNKSFRVKRITNLESGPQLSTSLTQTRTASANKKMSRHSTHKKRYYLRVRDTIKGNKAQNLLKNRNVKEFSSLHKPTQKRIRPSRSKRSTDVDECSLGRSVCQHSCINMRGSYRCTCPPGYRLGKDGYSCQDINECVENGITCGREKLCFNKRGSYSCIDIPCPPDYARDPTTNFCVLECVNPNIPCPPGAKYADVIQFRTVALPGGNRVRQDLIRLRAYNQHDQFLPQTVFVILDNDPKLNFYLKTDDGKGIVYTLKPLVDDSTYQITVRARSYDMFRKHIQYQTTFIIHISVSAFPY